MSLLSKAKAAAEAGLEKLEDLRSRAVQAGATTTPMTGAAIPTLDTPADSVISRVLPGAAPTAAFLLGAAGTVVAAKAIKAHKAKKPKAKDEKRAKKTDSRKSSSRGSTRPNTKSVKDAKKSTSQKLGSAKAHRSARKHAEDAGGVIPSHTTWKGKRYRVHIAPKSGQPYIYVHQRNPLTGKMQDMPRFIPK